MEMRALPRQLLPSPTPGRPRAHPEPRPSTEAYPIEASRAQQQCWQALAPGRAKASQNAERHAPKPRQRSWPTRQW
eukprot:14111951-Alexandrium_andersonii.AAC.1